MARRTQLFQKPLWTGGVNSSVDPGMLSANELQQADNVAFTVTCTRIKREGFDYFDTAIPSVSTRASSGTTRTITFASEVSIASPENRILVVGEKVTVSGAGNANYNTTEGIISAVTASAISYTFSGAASLAEATTADTGATVSKNYDVIGIHDLWYFNSS